MFSRIFGSKVYGLSAASAFVATLILGTVLYMDLRSNPMYSFDPTSLSEEIKVVSVSVAAIAFAVLGVVASSAFDLTARKGYRDVGFWTILKRTIGSTDFALSIFLFPFLFLTVVRSIVESEDLLLGLLVSFETGFVIKTVVQNFGGNRN